MKVKPGNAGGAVIARMDDANAHRGYDLYIAGDRAFAHFIHSWPADALKVETKKMNPESLLAKIHTSADHVKKVTTDASGMMAKVRPDVEATVAKVRAYTEKDIAEMLVKFREASTKLVTIVKSPIMRIIARGICSLIYPISSHLSIVSIPASLSMTPMTIRMKNMALAISWPLMLPSWTGSPESDAPAA